MPPSTQVPTASQQRKFVPPFKPPLGGTTNANVSAKMDTNLRRQPSVVINTNTNTKVKACERSTSNSTATTASSSAAWSPTRSHSPESAWSTPASTPPDPQSANKSAAGTKVQPSELDENPDADSSYGEMSFDIDELEATLRQYD